MSNSTYADGNTPGVLTHTVTLGVPELAGAGDFDHARDAQASIVTGGRFTSAFGGSYSYFDGGFDQGQDYCPFRDPAQNAGHGASAY